MRGLSFFTAAKFPQADLIAMLFQRLLHGLGLLFLKSLLLLLNH